MIITKYRDYFHVVSAYHNQPVSKRPDYLRGYVLNASHYHPDVFTRQKVAEFYAKEQLRHASKSSTSG